MAQQTYSIVVTVETDDSTDPASVSSGIVASIGTVSGVTSVSVSEVSSS